MMNNNQNSNTNTIILGKEKCISTQKGSRNTLDEKYCDQFMRMTLDTGCYALHTIKENASDYKKIGEDKNMSPVEMAMGKRKVLAADISLGICMTGGILGLLWLAKKVFVA